jgi:hypothetical protein
VRVLRLPWSQATKALAAWQGLAPHGPDHLYLICALETGSSTPQVRVFGQLLGGSEAAPRRVMAPITAVAPPKDTPTHSSKRALKAGNAVLALDLARQLTRVTLEDALALCLVRRKDEQLYQRATARWLPR